MFRALVLLFLASVVLAALALIDCLSEPDRHRLRGLPRWAWVLVILLVPLLGPVAYLLTGRPLPQGRTRAGGGWPASGGGTSRPKAPDDDPEFLRSLGSTFTSRDEELLRRWEEDRKRREEDRRRNGDG